MNKTVDDALAFAHPSRMPTVNVTFASSGTSSLPSPPFAKSALAKSCANDVEEQPTRAFREDGRLIGLTKKTVIFISDIVIDSSYQHVILSD
ncbi:hypothetical protein IE4872_PD01916 (plasmid) [Rhizobium gallicum]|uniref:Uncharacterized protein n=1 Tax=Rhizobium gallicum TaxID=56730 RepID=A0A1L5NWY8_9HYPH|nr:hypothetical protein [Rhizobium gallicum]APO72433.1 hypothetical protein IE4872_PD01916 [Rhizobium gallicum]